MASLKSGKEYTKNRIKQRLYDWKRSKYIGLFSEMIDDDIRKADADNLEEATIIATVITDEVYAWFRRTRKKVTTIGITGQPGTPAIGNSLPVSAAPDVNSGAIVWGEDFEFDIENPEN